MASLHSGGKPVLAEGNGKAAASGFNPQKSNSTKSVSTNAVDNDKENNDASTPQNLDSRGTKRKAQDEGPIEDDKGDASLASRAQDQETATLEDTPTDREKTPGRDGPIKEDRMSVEPDIKPFKGEPGRKVRKTAHEKEEEYRQFILENEGHTFHELHVCFNKGPNGSPTYDKSGFELDYDKVAQWMKPQAYSRSRAVNGMNKAIDKAKKDGERMAELFFEKGEAPDSFEISRQKDYWRDRVSKDLGIPWHKIGVEQFEEWDKRGFKKAKRGDYGNPTADEKKRMLRLMMGASLRK